MLLGLVGCTPVSDPAQVRLHASVDADEAVRRESLEVETRVEKQDAQGGGWITVDTRSFRPADTAAWPCRLELPSSPSMIPGRYQLTATARDAREAVVVQGRVIAELHAEAADVPTLRVYLEQACMRRSELCGPSMTCHAGECVSATDPAANKPTGAPSGPGRTGDAGSGTPGVGAGQEPKLAKSGAPCSSAEATSCSDGPGQVPLICRAGSWQLQPACQQNQRCAPESGECKAVAPECLDRTADEVFCDGDRMRVCIDLLSSVVQPCLDNERCVSDERGVRCGCKIGSSKGVAGCEPASECGSDYGGCDPNRSNRAMPKA